MGVSIIKPPFEHIFATKEQARNGVSNVFADPDAVSTFVQHAGYNSNCRVASELDLNKFTIGHIILSDAFDYFNAPPNTKNRLIVQTFGNGTYINQLAYGVDSKVYSRYRFNGTWGDWSTIANSESIKNPVTVWSGSATSVDLDSLADGGPGSYFVKANIPTFPVYLRIDLIDFTTAGNTCIGGSYYDSSSDYYLQVDQYRRLKLVSSNDSTKTITEILKIA